MPGDYPADGARKPCGALTTSLSAPEYHGLVTLRSAPIDYPRHVREVVATAVGAEHRRDAPVGHGGGPAGNAQLTALVGLVLLVLFFVEGLTLVSVHRLISWHIAVGAALVPVVLLKTFTTGWRIVRYYTGQRDYRTAGPPPLVLRLLGPLVVLTSLALLGTGLALIAVGPDATFRSLLSAGPLQVSALTLHQAAFAAWFVVLTVHVLARTIPALQLAGQRTGAPAVPGRASRLVVLVLTLASGVGVGAAVLAAASSWTSYVAGW